MEDENKIRRKKDDEAPAEKEKTTTGKRKLKKMILSQNFEDGLPDDFDDDNDIQYDSDGQQSNRKSIKRSKTKVNQVEVSSDEDGEIYPGLPAMSGTDNDFRYSKKENAYFLKGDFCLDKDKYDELFDHQKIGV